MNSNTRLLWYHLVQSVEPEDDELYTNKNRVHVFNWMPHVIAYLLGISLLPCSCEPYYLHSVKFCKFCTSSHCLYVYTFLSLSALAPNLFWEPKFTFILPFGLAYKRELQWILCFILAYLILILYAWYLIDGQRTRFRSWGNSLWTFEVAPLVDHWDQEAGDCLNTHMSKILLSWELFLFAQLLS